MTIDVEVQSGQLVLDDACTVVRHALHRVGALGGLGVLQHHGAVRIIGVHQREGAGGQLIEEALLGLDVFGEGAVVVEVIVRDVREDPGGELQTRDALLHHAVRAHLHEAVRHPFGQHLGQQFVEADGIRRGVRAGDRALTDADLHRADQSALVAQRAEQAEEQCGRAGLAVGARDAHELQLPGGLIMEIGGQQPQGLGSIRHTDVGHPLLQVGGELFADDGTSTRLHRPGDEGMTIHLGAAGGHEGRERGDLPAVEGDLLDGRVGRTHHLLDAHLVENVLQQLHASSMSMVEPCRARVPGDRDCRLTMPLPLMRTRSPRFSRR